MRIAIIGAGWFGCHVALATIEAGHDVHIFERGGEIFGGASNSNQNRLHCGYHYPRSFRTRQEIRLTHDRFIAKYPTRAVALNFFAVSNQSWIDLRSYLAIMRGDKIPVIPYNAKNHGIINVEDDFLLRTDELVIDTEAAKAAFAKALAGKVRLCCHGIPEPSGNGISVNGEAFDAVIDCTSGELKPDGRIFFEPAVMAEYEGPRSPDQFALTVMDGYFPCLYPTAQPGRWRVSHVFHTARGSFANGAEAAQVLGDLDPREITDVMTAAMCEYYPAFKERFRPCYNVVKAVRTKLKNNNASRECLTTAEGRLFRVFSGKICSIFLVEDQVMAWLKTL